MATNSTDIEETTTHRATRTPSRNIIVPLLLPVVLLTLLVAAVFVIDPTTRFNSGAPAVEDISFERTVLKPGLIELTIRNAAANPVTISQVIVDDAYWVFEMEPSNTLTRYQSATITLQYPWVEAEPVVIALVTSTGVLFDHEIAVAIATPQPTVTALTDYALIGLYVGVVPIVVGMLFFPALKRISKDNYNAILALTLGVLGFLAIDTVLEGFELAEDIPGALQGTGIFIASALAAIIAVLGLERSMRKRGAPAVVLAFLIAVGIGLHNLGEGLLIGSAFAVGSVTLGAALIGGFALHNVTEGPAIVGPLTEKAGLPWRRFLLLAAIGGVPTVIGAWLGGFTGNALATVVFFGLGAGAILVVLVQIVTVMRKHEQQVLTPTNMMAFGIGFLLMLGTALLLAA